jgi:hypothetical protein
MQRWVSHRVLFQYLIPNSERLACVACGVIAVGALSPQHAAWFHILNVAVVQYWYRAASQQGMPAVYMDMASLATLPKYTCGQLYSLPAFSAKRDGAKLAHDVRHNLSRPTAWEAVMRIRCSKGLRISSFHGHFFIRSSDLLALPQVSPPCGHTFCEMTQRGSCIIGMSWIAIPCRLHADVPRLSHRDW